MPEFHDERRLERFYYHCAWFISFIMFNFPFWKIFRYILTLSILFMMKFRSEYPANSKIMRDETDHEGLLHMSGDLTT